MKPVFLSLGVLLVALFPFNASAADCRAIVANTLAELKAAYPEWDDSMETLVRTAAGSACVKASSAAPATTQIQERAVRSDGEVVSMESAPVSTTVNSTAVAASDSTDGGSSESSASSDDSKDKEDSGWNPFKDIKFNKVSASPNKKPYERRRDVNKAAPASEEDESE